MLLSDGAVLADVLGEGEKFGLARQVTKWRSLPGAKGYIRAEQAGLLPDLTADVGDSR